mmetsp:Transcript_1322/g.3012  ORF Transcript_1322/g.3012 Transcript_1322/m.3012 type:complete len:216 (+) Transcript_1322:435-1082(+)
MSSLYSRGGLFSSSRTRLMMVFVVDEVAAALAVVLLRALAESVDLRRTTFLVVLLLADVLASAPDVFDEADADFDFDLLLLAFAVVGADDDAPVVIGDDADGCCCCCCSRCLAWIPLGTLEREGGATVPVVVRCFMTCSFFVFACACRCCACACCSCCCCDDDGCWCCDDDPWACIMLRCCIRRRCSCCCCGVIAAACRLFCARIWRRYSVAFFQ